MNLCVYGAAGFLGSRLCGLLEKRGHAVARFDPASGDGRAGHRPDPEPGTDAVVFLGQSPHYRDVPRMAWHVIETNVAEPLRVAARCAELGVPKFLYASTGSVYAPSFQPLAETAPPRRDGYYPLSKIHAEEALALLRDRLAVCLVRPFGLFGEGQRGMLVANIIDAVRDRKTVTVQPNPHDPDDDGGLRISLCHADDAARCFADLAALDPDSLPRVVNLAGPEPVSIRRLAETAGAVLGLEPDIARADTPRPGDLIADLAVLNAAIAPTFTPFDDALGPTVRAAASTRPAAP